MCSNPVFEDILHVSNNKNLCETGGGHAQKGTEFQKHWAVLKMFQLAEGGQQDFLLIFEFLQDVAIFNSSIAPSSVQVYQVKKKDRNEWTWGSLTDLKTPSKHSTKPQPPQDALNSPLGKLYVCVKSVSSLESTGYFISNAGCNLTLKCGGNAATSVSTKLSELSEPYLSSLLDGLKGFKGNAIKEEDISQIHVEKVCIPVDAPKTYLVGAVAQYLEKHSPEHKGQAISLVDALLAKIGPLGTKTDKCTDFSHLQRRQGYSMHEFNEALNSMEQKPDILPHLELFLRQLEKEGLHMIDRIAIQAEAVSIHKRELQDSKSEKDCLLERDCDDWLQKNPMPTNFLQYLRDAHKNYGAKHKTYNKNKFFAALMIRGIKKWATPT